MRPRRVVDAHVHLWDPERTDWYPYIKHYPVHGPGDASRMRRRFDVVTYREETAGWNVEKFVNVAAATGQNSIDETLELDALSEERGGPDGIIGGLPPAETVADAIAYIDRQMEAARFRGVRPMGGLDRPVPEAAVLRALAERQLVFELMAHPDRLDEAAALLAPVDDLAVVVEHAGWPRSDSDEERELWRSGIDALAALGERVSCKLSGLAMPFASVSESALRPWIEYALERFGVERCFFASNFPVDAPYGTFDEVYESFSVVTADLNDDERDKLFAANAERIYRL